MKKIGIIGTGNMGYAFLKGLVSVYGPDQILVTDVNKSKREAAAKETGVECVADNAELVKNAEYIVLAVKPQYYDSVLRRIKNVLTEDHILISIAAGITIDSLKERLGPGKRIVRAMPNTPALIGAGMAGVSYEETLFTQEEKDTIQSFFESIGKMVVVPEHMMNVVTCASSSAPAYIFMFIEALADSAVKYGMPREMAYRTIAQAVKGSAELVLETGEHPGKLKDQVRSPGGTTIAAVAALEEFGLRNAIFKATDACYEKCTDLKQM